MILLAYTMIMFDDGIAAMMNCEANIYSETYTEGSDPFGLKANIYSKAYTEGSDPVEPDRFGEKSWRYKLQRPLSSFDVKNVEFA